MSVNTQDHFSFLFDLFMFKMLHRGEKRQTRNRTYVCMQLPA